LKAVNRLARQLERAGMVDLRQERLRKSDHLNPLADIPDLERVVGDAGFGIARIRYYTPLIGAFVENILMRVAERALARWARRRRARGGAAFAAGARRLAASRGRARAEGTRGSAPLGAEEEALRARARRPSSGWPGRGRSISHSRASPR
jgi:hypothetical protein